MFRAVVDSLILSKSVVEYYIRCDAFGIAIDGAPVAKCQWPVVARSLKRLPKAEEVRFVVPSV